MDTQTSTITRRELLRKGALVGGAVLWVTPVVQVVGMGRAYAKDVSPNCTRFCLKWETDDNDETLESTCVNSNAPHAYPVWTNIWVALGDGEGNVLTCPGDGVNSATTISDKFVVYGSQSVGFWIAFPNDIKLADLTDVGQASVGAKCGNSKVTFDLSLEDDPCFEDSLGDAFQRIHITGCGTGQDISHIELIIDWCP